ncbi:MAG: hypothetical protein WD274_01495 [Acidimicrobiia bacterium]
MSLEPAPGVDLYWIPLGAGGAALVRVNGRIYEAVKARSEGRKRLDLYHTALEVRVPDGRYTVENGWPSPDSDIASRGVVVEGPVWSRRLYRFRIFRYEVRCWKEGTIPDASEAVASPQLLNDDPDLAARLLGLVPMVPPLVWGRDELHAGEMWNSNSVVAWLLCRAGVDLDGVEPPVGGRAPGWDAGVVVARHS